MYKSLSILLFVILVIVVIYFVWFNKPATFSDPTLQAEVDKLVEMVSPYYCDKLKKAIDEEKKIEMGSMTLNQALSTIDSSPEVHPDIKAQLKAIITALYNYLYQDNKFNKSNRDQLLDDIFNYFCKNVNTNNVKYTDLDLNPMILIPSFYRNSDKTKESKKESFRNHKRYDF